MGPVFRAFKHNLRTFCACFIVSRRYAGLEFDFFNGILVGTFYFGMCIFWEWFMFFLSEKVQFGSKHFSKLGHSAG